MLDAAAKRERQAGEASAYDDAVGAWDSAAASSGSGSESSSSGGAAGQAAGTKGSMKVVLITGFESFNVDLYKKAAVQLAAACPGISLRVFSDRDLGESSSVCAAQCRACPASALCSGV